MLKQSLNEQKQVWRLDKYLHLNFNCIKRLDIYFEFVELLG